jgi:hypothetical protein
MKPQEKTASRRGLIFGAAAVGTAATALVALPQISPQDTPQVELKPAPEKGGGYQLTAHVKHYYRTALI